MFQQINILIKEVLQGEIVVNLNPIHSRLQIIFARKG